MGRKKRNLNYVKPFCYYCDKVFTSEVILHQHQKSKHFTCQECKKKFPTSHNMITHLQRKHQKTISKIPNSLPDRQGTELNIFGLYGVPRSFIEEKMIFGAIKYWKGILDRNEKVKMEREEQKEEDAPIDPVDNL